MPITTLALAGSLPIVVILVLMVGLRWSAVRAMSVGWVIASALGLFLWDMELGWWVAAAFYGVLQSIDIILIVFGAILLMNHLQASGAIDAIRVHFGDVVQDARIQLLLIGLGFMTLIEGVAGFGTPGALGAPLLTGLGFTPMAAATFGLLMNVPNPPLGAAGVPVLGGIGAVIDEAVLGGTMEPLTFLRQVAGWTGVFTGTMLALLGLMGVFFLIYWFGSEGQSSEDTSSLADAWRATRSAAPFALALGAVAGLTQFLVGWFVGPELPSAMAGVAALGTGLLMVRHGVLVPKDVWRLPEEESQAQTSEALGEAGEGTMSVWLAWAPYMLVVLLLFVTRMPGLGLREPLRGVVLEWEQILGQDIAFTLRPLFIPGVIPFIPVAILTALFHRIGLKETAAAWGKTFRQTATIALTLVVAISMAQVMIRSATNPDDLPGMMQALSMALAQAAGQAHPFVAPWVGSLGSFMTGSSTSSNILFSVVQHDAAADLGLSRTLIVALQNAGTGPGNMISVLNIAAVSGVLGLRRVEGDLMRRLLIPMIVLAILIGLGGLLLAPVLAGIY